MKTTKKRLEKLWKKYSSNTCNRKEFDEWFDILRDEDLDEDAIKQLFEKKWDDLQPKALSNKLPQQRWYYNVAAAVLLCLGFGTLFLIHQDRASTKLSEQAIATVDFSLPVVTLPDGSTVALQEGSRLNLKKDFLSGNSREVILEGEAFFDIAHNPKKPFVVHTGTVKTTALGTAFSVRAVPGTSSIIVAVMEGKVKVEDGTNFLTTLEADQRFSYGIEVGHLLVDMEETEMPAEAGKMGEPEPEADRVPHELIFRNMSFGDIVQELAAIHGVNIVFANEALKGRRIDALLDSRNPLEALLQSLCALQHATYSIEGKTYVIK